MTVGEIVYQVPRSPLAVRSADRRSQRGESEFTRGPSTASNAGRNSSAERADISATHTPPTAIEYRNRCGQADRAAMAAATVSALNATVRPAVARVRTSASE